MGHAVAHFVRAIRVLGACRSPGPRSDGAVWPVVGHVKAATVGTSADA